MQYRDAAVADSPVLAEMNHQLIQDEGHSNPMSVAELEDRMRGWLQGDYKAIIFSDEQGSIGYALWRPEPEGVYLRQFLVHRDRRRQGLGRTAMDWLLANTWRDVAHVRLDVLAGNARAISFWRAVGCIDYCLTMVRPGPGYRAT